jgi:hypothetical protein
MKKIIIFLSILLLILGLVLLLIVRNNKKPIPVNNSSEKNAFPTGIIVPTSEIKKGTVDIVSIYPPDQSKDVELNKSIDIKFSRTIFQKDFEFFIDPDTPHTLQIDKDRLIVQPTSGSWVSGTTYRFSINFTSDNQKVRLYSFTTKGEIKESTTLPDTQPSGLVELELQEQKKDAPDLYVTNHTPYEAKTFTIISDFEAKAPAHMFFKVTSKIDNKETVKQDVLIWLQLLDLTEAQIKSLDIRYE